VLTRAIEPGIARTDKMITVDYRLFWNPRRTVAPKGKRWDLPDGHTVATLQQPDFGPQQKDAIVRIRLITVLQICQRMALRDAPFAVLTSSPGPLSRRRSGPGALAAPWRRTERAGGD
jgi:hypothetical protein